MPEPSRDEIEKMWIMHLRAAAEADQAAREEYRRALADAVSLNTEESRLALDEARRNETATRAEYLRVLRILKSLRIKRTRGDRV